MELYPLQVFLTVATEQELFAGGREAAAHAAGRVAGAATAGAGTGREADRPLRQGPDPDRRRPHVLEYARRFESLQLELDNSLAELRDNSAGRLIIGANESTILYLLRHIEQYRELYPKVKVQVRRSFSSKIPNELLDGNLELGVISYDPGDERLRNRK
jgi:hypothetical protein